MTGKPKATKRVHLNAELIVEAALELTDSSRGLDALTVRSLAKSLDVGPMTLYSYYRGKDEILDAMADHVLGGFQLPDCVGSETPAMAIRAVADGFLSLMREHPSVVFLLSTRVTRSQAALHGAMEAVIGRLVDSGLSGEDAVKCYGFLIQYAMGFAAYQAPRWWGRPDVEDAPELRRRQQHFYSALPASEFPYMIALAPHIVALPGDDMYDLSVDALVALMTSK